MSPDQTRSPVAGSVETSPLSWVVASACRFILRHGFAHSANGCNLVVERPPVVALGNRRPDRLDLLDLHRAWRVIRPICVRGRSAPAFERLGQRAKRFAGIALRSRVATAAPLEQNPIYRSLSSGEGGDQGGGERTVVGRSDDPEPPHHGCDQRLFKPSAPG